LQKFVVRFEFTIEFCCGFEMGLRGAGAKKRSVENSVRVQRRMPWKKKGLSRVERVMAFLEFTLVTKGILVGRKMKLLPGQRRFIEAVYGQLSRDGRRKIRIAIKSEPRGNGKTGLLAGLALCHLLGPECEARGEIYSAAYNKLQAALIFAEMKAIVEAVPEFDARCNIQRYGKVIEVMSGDGAGSIYESLSADDKRAHGLAASNLRRICASAKHRFARQFTHGNGQTQRKSWCDHQHAGGQRSASAQSDDRRRCAGRGPVRLFTARLGPG
jgi:hypothetical protein